MMRVRFVLESRASLRTISWKTLAACIAGAILASTIAHAELPVAVPGNGGRNSPGCAKQTLLGGFPGSRVGHSPLFLFTGLGAPYARYANRSPAVAGSGQSRSLLVPI